MIEIDNIYNMDCIEGMKLMANGSVDAVIADLPYGVLNRSNKAVHWDRQIPLEALWEQYRRITKPGSPVILFAQGIFSARLMLSQPRMWRYNLVWRKDRVTGHLNANRMPLRQHEDIIVFYDRQPVYHPQMMPCPPERKNHGRRKTDENFARDIRADYIALYFRVAQKVGTADLYSLFNAVYFSVVRCALYGNVVDIDKISLSRAHPDSGNSEYSASATDVNADRFGREIRFYKL